MTTVEETKGPGGESRRTSHITRGNPFLKPNGEPYFVAIGLPSDDIIYTDMALSLAAIVAQGGVRYGILNQRGCYVHQNRDRIVEEAIKGGFDYLFFIDADIIAPPNTVLRLLSHKKQVAAATYVKRKPPHTLLGAVLSGNQVPSSGLHEFAELPTGCMLIDLAVFSIIKDDGPHFRTPVINGKTKGEDIDFCHRCMEKGVKLYCDIDLSLTLGHVGLRPFNIVEEQMKIQQQMAAEKANGTGRPPVTVPTPIEGDIPVPMVAADGVA